MENEEKIVNSIRALSIDMINNAKSGHPGIVLSAAPILYTLYLHHLNIKLDDDKYFNRDRFVLSCGHGSALLYSILYFAGYLSLDDLKSFRQIDSITPGHPEYPLTPLVDMTTGPLGQGFATAVGMAIAEKKQNADLNGLIDHYTYVLVSDGDLMEGISYEAASLAGTLKLNKLIALYDKNNISLDGSTNLTFTEDIKARFIALGWNVIETNDKVIDINGAIKDAKNSDKPTIIMVDTILGKYSKYENSNIAHGMTLYNEDVTDIKVKLGIRDIPFAVSTECIEEFRKTLEERCKNIGSNDVERIESLDIDKRKYFEYITNSDKSIKNITFTDEITDRESPRDTSSKILNKIVLDHRYIFGGSADLFSSTKTYINNLDDFSDKTPTGQSIYFGVREHAMGAIANGLALCGFRPYISTFMAFSDYLRPSIRLAAMMNLPVVYIFTHDSISVGEDGPTHEPVEQLESLRLIPNLEVFRPADANEVIGTYKAVFEKKASPSVISLSRNTLNVLTSTKINDVSLGGYILREEQRNLDGILISSGEDIHLALKVADNLKIKGIDLRVVSVPNINRFIELDDKTYDNILPVEKKKIVISTEIKDAWYKIIYNEDFLITMNSFGASGSKKDVYKKFGFDIEELSEKIESLLK